MPVNQGFLEIINHFNLKFVYLLLKTIEPIADVEGRDLFSIRDLDFLWGEKLCSYQKISNSNKVLLAAWRELKKLLDSIVIYDGDLWYEKNMKKYKMIKGSRNKILNVINRENIHMSSLENIIEAFKFYSVACGNVFSKVFWIDYYIERMSDQKINFLMNTIFEVDHPSEINFNSWINIMQSNLKSAVVSHKMMNSCSICTGQFEKCNIGRCSGDYLYDAMRAIKRNYKISTVLCIRRTYEYLKKAYEMYGLEIIVPEDWNAYWSNVQNRCDEYKDIIVQLLFEKVE